MEPITWLALAALVGKITTVVKAFGKDWRMVITQVVVWTVGTLVVWLAGESTLGGGLEFSGVTAANMNFADYILAGTALGSSMSVVYDFKKARDNSDSAAEPALYSAPGKVA